jgi:hypothetical protein
MRVIEKQMLAAIINLKYFSNSNTMVNPYNGYSDIYLHGHHIAEYDNATNKVKVNIDTLRNWPTNTTKSRLRALGVNVTTKKGITYLDNVAI